MLGEEGEVEGVRRRGGGRECMGNKVVLQRIKSRKI